mmetsp:Transcript_98290/g.174201  ORF Transcript_98290/g.174201 Transcript_98290/m.174201 type:complete len:162 (+) Transcript_98290:114-599(+)
MATVVQATVVETNPQPVSAVAPPAAGEPVKATAVAQPVPVQAAVIGQPVAVAGQPVAVAMYGGAAMGAQGIPAEDPTILAVIACFCCCWCVGIVAIMKAQKVNQFNMMGNYAQAHVARKEAMQWIMGTVAAGVVIMIINVVITFVADSQEDHEPSSSRYDY